MNFGCRRSCSFRISTPGFYADGTTKVPGLRKDGTPRQKGIGRGRR